MPRHLTSWSYNLRLYATAFLAALIICCQVQTAQAVHAHQWNAAEKKIIKSLWIRSLGPPPVDPSNRYTENVKAIILGRKLFFDTRFSLNGKVACSTCHIPEKGFTDNLPVAHGIADTTRRTMPLAGTAYFPWLFWDGRADSLWAQALGPIESPKEHGISRSHCAILIQRSYKNEYEEIFGPIPVLPANNFSLDARPAKDNKDIQSLWEAIPEETRHAISHLYANLGKAIAAYVRTIEPGPAPFDHYAAAVLNNDKQKMEHLFTLEEAMGLKIFIGKAHCINCHNGPLFTNADFHNVGIPAEPGKEPDLGRAPAISQVLANEFNCLSRHSDAAASDCAELEFIDQNYKKYLGAMKVPSLRNVADRPPYMHAGQLKSIRDVLRFYQRTAIKKSAGGMATDITHGVISDNDVIFLEAFLKTLSGPISAAQ